MSLKTGMFVFRLLQNEYSASITAQNPDLISGYNLCRREAREQPTADVFYLLARGLSVQPLISSYVSCCSVSTLKVISLVSSPRFDLASIVHSV